MARDISQDWADFIREASRVAREQQYPLSVLLGQAAVETGRRTPPGYNYFGIKGQGQVLPTTEYGAGGYYQTPQSFRAYQTPEQSIKDYLSLIMRRYPQAWNLRSNPEAMVRAIAQGGYATDPQYAQKVLGTPEFRQFRSAVPPQVRQPTSFFPSLIPQAYAAEQAPTIPRALPVPLRSTYGLPYAVQRGDTLWDIAQRFLGSGARWRELGYTGDPRQLPIGTQVRIPRR